MLNQMCPNHRTYASLPTTLIATSEATRVSIMSNQEHHEKNSRSTNSRALTISRNTTPKREGLVSKYQIKSTTKKKGSIMSNQEHHEKKGSICQIKSTTKKKDQ